MPRERGDEYALANLPDNVAAIFEEIQVSNANHEKNRVNLYKLHDEARVIIKQTKGGGVSLVGERAFQKAFLTCVFKTLNVKKGDVCADRTARFVGVYLKFVNEKGVLPCFLFGYLCSISLNLLGS